MAQSHLINPASVDLSVRLLTEGLKVEKIFTRRKSNLRPLLPNKRAYHRAIHHFVSDGSIFLPLY